MNKANGPTIAVVDDDEDDEEFDVPDLEGEEDGGAMPRT